MDTVQQSPSSGVSGRTLVRSLMPTVILGIVVPLVTFNVAKSQGASDLTAYLLACVGPLIQSVGSTVVRRQVDRVSLFVLLLNLVSAAVTVVGSTSPVVLLLKDSVATGVFGLFCLGTLVAGRRPLMYSFAQQFSGGADSPRGRRFEEMWQTLPGFRRMFRVITTAWGVGFLVEAAVKVVVAETVSFTAAYSLNQVLPLVFFAGLMVWNVWYARRVQRRGEARAEAAVAATEAG